MTRREITAKVRGRLKVQALRLRKWMLIRKVKARKRARAAIPQVYTERPAMSVVIQSFNHRGNVDGIVDGLRRTDVEEIIVCEDGSVDGSAAAWLRRLDRPNDFVIQSNDLHEIRTYDRAVSLARGEIVALLQDDDIPPADGRWTTDAARIFAAHPQIGVLGCWNGCADQRAARALSDPLYPGGAWEVTAADIPFTDGETGLPMMFVDAVWIGPLFFRRDAFLELGGFDHTFSGPGEPGIWLDYDLCMRMWGTGRRVALFGTEPFRRNVGGQGTLMFSGGKRAENYKRNRAYVERTYGPGIDRLHDEITALNAGLAVRPRMSVAL